jgi:hypothetical protein
MVGVLTLQIEERQSGVLCFYLFRPRREPIDWWKICSAAYLEHVSGNSRERKKVFCYKKYSLWTLARIIIVPIFDMECCNRRVVYSQTKWKINLESQLEHSTLRWANAKPSGAPQRQTMQRRLSNLGGHNMKNVTQQTRICFSGKRKLSSQILKYINRHRVS